ncbi:hypothetical protein TNCV_866361 [Trichonephila clavipes]|nr:hypothetical protein TNCV_866361 [Trichonephila clavipes]
MDSDRTIPRRRIRAHYEQLSEFERGRITGLKEAGWTNRRITRHMGRKDKARPHVAINCLTACQTLPWLARPPDLLHRACLGYDGKTTASTREC